MTIDKFGRHLKVVGSTHQTIVDKFGRHLRGRTEKIHSTFLPRTVDGNYDVGGKRLCNIQDPKDKQDCATKNYVTKRVEEVKGRGNTLTMLLENKMNTRLRSLEDKINGIETQLKQKLDVLENDLNSIHRNNFANKLDSLDQQIQSQLSLLQKRIEDLEKK